MMRGRFGAAACALALFAGACGGEDGGGGSGPVAATPTPNASPTPAPATASCSLASRQAWVKAALDEWYLFPENLATGVNPASHSTMDSYIDAMVAPARALNRDRHFTYLTSIAEENAYYEQGESAGFGMQLTYFAGTVGVLDAFEGGPALAAGIDRGSRILAIGTSADNMVDIDTLVRTGGGTALANAFGPETVGTTRTMRVAIGRFDGPVRTVTLTKGIFKLDPISDRYGVKVFWEGQAQPTGYLSLRTFIDTAEPDLIAAFAEFKAKGVTDLVIDLRYNGGGLVRVAQTLGDLMAAGRDGQEFGRLEFRQSKAAENERYPFSPRPESIAPRRVAFITTGSSASASELVINALLPYLGQNVAIVGENTYGKPVGQIALDNPGCDDRLRAVAFRTVNAAGLGDYYSGLAPFVPYACAARDDIDWPLGNDGEASLSVALGWVANGGYCSPMGVTASASASRARVGTSAQPHPLMPAVPGSTRQREMPGTF